jgi:hypothetical protein
MEAARKRFVTSPSVLKMRTPILCLVLGLLPAVPATTQIEQRDDTPNSSAPLSVSGSEMIGPVASAARDMASPILQRSFAGVSVQFAGMLMSANPTTETCPVSNCPSTPKEARVLSAQDMHGMTTRGAVTPEWESVIGLYANTGHPNGQKVVQYLGGMQGPSAGTLWTLNTDIVRCAIRGGSNSFDGQPGSGTGCPSGTTVGGADGTIGYELDLTNWSEDDAPGGAFVVGEFIHTLSTYSSLAGIYYGSTGATSWHDGIFFSGNNTARDNAIFDSSGASFGYQCAGRRLSGESCIYDSSVGFKYGLAISGSHSTTDIYDTSNAPTAINIAGSHVKSAYSDNSASPEGISLRGKYSLGAIDIASADITTHLALNMAPGQIVCFGNGTSCVHYDMEAHKWYFTNSASVTVLSIDDRGNAIFRGTVTGGGAP